MRDASDSTPAAAQPEPARSDRNEAEQEILDAAAALFSERGFEGASLDAVAQRMGATKGRVYHYFRSKTALFCALYQDAMDQLEALIAVAAEAAPEEPATARLAAMAEAHVLGLLENREAHRVGMIGINAAARAAAREEDHAALEGLRRRQEGYEARFRAAIESAAKAGDAPPPTDPIALKTLLIALNGALFFRPLPEDASDETRRAVAARIARQALFGLAAAGAADREGAT